MTFLIDTHYVLWAAIRPERIASWARSLLVNTSNKVLVSAATLYEIGIKVRNGRLPDAVEFERNLVENIERMGFDLVSLNARVMMRASRFPAEHADPFDRMIAAQAIELDLELLSVDAHLDAFGVRRLQAFPVEPRQ